MRSWARALLLLGLLAPASDALATDVACRDRRYHGDLTALFVAPRELGADWDSVRESPSDPADDPEFRAAGVLATHGLHYTRERAGGSEVCSLEIWRLASSEAARRAQAAIGLSAWRYALRGNLLIMSRGVSLDRAHGFRPGLLPECHRLVDLTEALAEQKLGCSESR
jgi:hypothetical protein